MTVTPFFALAGTGLLCGLICLFVYRSLERNRRLDAQNRKLAFLLMRLEQQNVDLDQFATMAAHDLQAPLRFMVNQAHLLDMDIRELERPELAAMTNHIIEQGDRMHALMLDLLAFCRAGQDSLDIADIDIQKLVSDEIERLQAKADYQGTEVQVGNLPPSVLADRQKLAIIVANLLDNAAKFSSADPSPVVHISAREHGSDRAWQFLVRDNGCGIEPAHRESVFRPFSRLDASKSGTGVGLSIVRKLVERHQGEVTIASADGGGTVVAFTLPKSPMELTP